MRRTLTSLALGAMLVALSFHAEAQQPKKVYRIGYLSDSEAATDAARSEGIQLALREFGYVEGQNIAIEYRYTDGKQARLFELAAELVRLNVDIILTAGGTYTVQMAKAATGKIPIVMVGQGIDPVESGLVKSLARPGGNVTGITDLTTKLGGKRLELLKEAVPNVARVAALYHLVTVVTTPSALEVKKVLPAAAGALGLTVRSWAVPNADGFERVFAALNKQSPDGLYVPVDALMTANHPRIVDFALKNRLPSMYGNREAVDTGGLMSYGAHLADSYRRVAVFVDKILKGAKPADLPVEEPKQFELVINLKTAQQIGLTISPNVLAIADEVIR